MGKKKKKFKWKKLIVILVIIIVIIIAFFSCAQKASQAAFIREEAARRDIRTYHSFSGNIKPVTEQNVYTNVTGAKVVKLQVEEGDEVREGDVLFYLDTQSIDEQIEQLSMSMSVNAAGAELSVRQAWDNYNNYRRNVDDGLVTQLITAKQTVENAQSQMEIAQREYEREVSANATGKSQTIESAKNSVDTAYQAVRQAQISLETAQHAYGNAADEEKEYQAKKQMETAESSLNTAWLNYQNAIASKAAAENSESKTIDTLYDQLVSAQTSYLYAVDSYNAAQRTVNETLASYRTQYEQALVNADASVNQLKLESLYRQLEDCCVRSPMNGVVTKLSAKAGDVIAAGTAAAVVTDFDRMEVEIRINEYDILGASVGEEVELTLNALGKDYVGVISEISRVATVNGGVSYFDSKVEFEADENVRSGMSVEVRLITNDLHDVLTVKSRAISTREDGTAYVTVIAEDGKTQEQRDVECGATDGTYIEILSGLEEGETVLYTPLSMEEIRDQMMGE